MDTYMLTFRNNSTHDHKAHHTRFVAICGVSYAHKISCSIFDLVLYDCPKRAGDTRNCIRRHFKRHHAVDSVLTACSLVSQYKVSCLN